MISFIYLLIRYTTHAFYTNIDFKMAKSLFLFCFIFFMNSLNFAVMLLYPLDVYNNAGGQPLSIYEYNKKSAGLG